MGRFPERTSCSPCQTSSIYKTRQILATSETSTSTGPLKFMAIYSEDVHLTSLEGVSLREPEQQAVAHFDYRYCFIDPWTVLNSATRTCHRTWRGRKLIAHGKNAHIAFRKCGDRIIAAMPCRATAIHSQNYKARRSPA